MPAGEYSVLLAVFEDTSTEEIAADGWRREGDEHVFTLGNGEEVCRRKGVHEVQHLRP